VAIKKQMTEVSLTPDASFVEPVVGAWTNPRLGRIEIRREGSGFVLDAGEWKSAIGEHKDKTGVRRILLTDPPFAGLAFWPQTKDGQTELLFETAQQKYLFTRAGR
jgi:hypothetical protein